MRRPRGASALVGAGAGFAAAALAAGAMGWGRGERPVDEATGREEIPVALRAPVRSRLWSGSEAPTLHWLGHSGFLLTWHGTRIVLDPHLGARCAVARRTCERPLPAEEWPSIDAVLITHAHLDHLDPRTLRSIRPREVWAPVGSEHWLPEPTLRAGRLRILVPGELRTLGRLQISATEARHNGSRLHPLASRELAVGWVVSDGESAIYFAGDTGAGDHFSGIRADHHPRVAVLPIGAWAPRIPLRWFHLSPGEAVEVATGLGVELAIPSHYGTFRLSLDAPRRALPRFAEAAARAGLRWATAPLLRSPRQLLGATS